MMVMAKTLTSRCPFCMGSGAIKETILVHQKGCGVSCIGMPCNCKKETVEKDFKCIECAGSGKSRKVTMRYTHRNDL